LCKINSTDSIIPESISEGTMMSFAYFFKEIQFQNMILLIVNEIFPKFFQQSIKSNNESFAELGLKTDRLEFIGFISLFMVNHCLLKGIPDRINFLDLFIQRV
jgi:hypothetical protein